MSEITKNEERTKFYEALRAKRQKEDEIYDNTFVASEHIINHAVTFYKDMMNINGTEIPINCTAPFAVTYQVARVPSENSDFKHALFTITDYADGDKVKTFPIDMELLEGYLKDKGFTTFYGYKEADKSDEGFIMITMPYQEMEEFSKEKGSAK